MFRDQSQSVIRKAKSQQAKNSTKQNNKSANLMSQSTGTVETSHQASLANLPGLNTPLDEKAKCYFMFSFMNGTIYHAIDNVIFSGTGDFRGVLSPYTSENTDRVLDASLKATSLACYANHIRSPQLEEASQRQYMEAIRSTNEALQTAGDAVKDTTLLSVNLLGLYEILSGRSKHSMKDWAHHIKGAAALIKLRGDEQFRTSTGRQVFLQTTCSLLTCCLQWNLRLPDHIVAMTEHLVEGMGDTRWRVRLFQAMLDFNQFRYGVRRGLISDPHTIVKSALSIDWPLARVCENFPFEWKFQVFIDKELDPELAYNSTYHVYPQASVSDFWNRIRVFRILIHQQIRQVHLKEFSVRPERFAGLLNPNQFEQSTEICCKMQADILASVPQRLGHLKIRSSDRLEDCTTEAVVDTLKTPWKGGLSTATTDLVTDYQSTSELASVNFRCDHSRQTHAITSSMLSPSIAGFALLWPLWIAGAFTTTPEDVRNYCIKALERIGIVMGINHALVLTHLLKSKSETVVWTDDVWNETE